MQNDLRREKYNDIFIITLIFAAGVMIHFFMADFNKALLIYDDDVRYWHLARNIFHGLGLRMRNFPTTMQKIGYPLIIAPLFAIADGILRLRVLAFLNSFVMMLGVFPAWLIAKYIGLDRKICFLVAVLAAIWPDTMLTITFQSEVLYWPIFLLFIYIWLKNENESSYKLAIVEGVLCYAGYLTKEVFLAIPLTYAVFELIYPVLVGKKLYSKKRALLFLTFILIFAACHVSAKILFFGNIGGSYKGGRIRMLTSYEFTTFLYAFFYYVSALLITALIVPFVYPVIHFKSMSENGRKIFCYIVLFFLINSAMINYTVSLWEDVGKEIPKIHLRYYGPAFVVLIAAFFHCISKVNSDEYLRHKRFFAEILFFASFYAFMMFRGTPTSVASQYTLVWYSAFADGARGGWPGVLLPTNGREKIFYIGAILANFFAVAITGVFYYIYARKNKFLSMKFFALAILVMCIADDFAVCITLRKAYGRTNPYSEAMINESLRINEFFSSKSKNDSHVLYITEGYLLPVYGNQASEMKRYTYGARYIDTYFVCLDNLYYVVAKDFLAHDNIINLKETELKADLGPKKFKNPEGIDYIIIENVIDPDAKLFSNVEKVDEISGKHFTVYKNLDPEIIKFSDKI